MEYDQTRKHTLKVATLWLSVRLRYLISVRSDPLDSVEELRLAVDAGQHFHSTLSLTIELLQKQADVLLNIMRSAADTANRVEKVLTSNRLPRRADLGGIRRDLVRLQRLLAPEPDALFRLLNRPPNWLREDDLQGLRRATEEYSVALRDMAGLQEMIKLLEDEIAARVAEHTNRTVFVLTAVTAVALPINLIAGLLGMNVGGLPFRYSPDGFWIIVLLAMLATGLAAWLILRLWRR